MASHLTDIHNVILVIMCMGFLITDVHNSIADVRHVNYGISETELCPVVFFHFQKSSADFCLSNYSRSRHLLFPATPDTYTVLFRYILNYVLTAQNNIVDILK